MDESLTVCVIDFTLYINSERGSQQPPLILNHQGQRICILGLHFIRFGLATYLCGL